MLSRPVSSNQTSIHPDLERRVVRHQQYSYEKPIASHSQRQFSLLQHLLGSDPDGLILDSGCGTGESTRLLAQVYPDQRVIGVDRSAHRLARYTGKEEYLVDKNLILIRMDLVDLWRLLLRAGIRIDAHFLFYPNPWPLKKHLQRRWHGHPVFPDMLKLSPQLELRTNWHIYQQEFSLATRILGYHTEDTEPKDSPAVSPFETKYRHSGHALYCTVMTSCPLDCPVL